MKKETLVLFIGILLLFSFIAVISASNYPSRDSRAEFLCLRQCLDEKKNESLHCTLDSIWELYDCKYKNRLCIFNMQQTGGQNATKVQKCRLDFSNCNKAQNNKKRECQNLTNYEYSICKKSCKQMVTNCTNDYNPICGVNGITYTNECLLRKAGINKDYDGVCEHSCIHNSDCESDEFCRFPAGSCTWNFNYLDAGSVNCLDPRVQAIDKLLNGCVPSGKCTKTPKTCTAEYNPVCGCDKKTYSNDCLLESNKQSKAYNGECREIDCAQLLHEITLEMDKAQRCDNNTVCIIGFLGNPCSVFTCGSGYNIFANLTQLKKLSDQYIEMCNPICPMSLCIDPFEGRSKCINNKCQIIYFDNNNNRLKNY